MKVAIAGAGIGGLTAALCLRQAGHHVTVLEQAPDISEVGAGIQMSPNAMKVFRALGLAPALEAVSFRPEALEARMGRSGMRVFSLPIDDAVTSRWGDVYLHVHRADLVGVLLDAAQHDPGIDIRLNSSVSDYRESSTLVHVTLSDGRNCDCELLIGADGIHSTVRARMLGPSGARFTGNVAWRVVVPTEMLGEHAPPPSACVWFGRNRHAVTYRLRGGALSNLASFVERDDWTEESWLQQGTREEALADFADWHPTITTMLECAEAHFRWAIFDRPPLHRWHSQRVALLGDACHPTMPFMAQGAAMAIEDAYALARHLPRSPDQDLSPALNRYYQARIARATHIQTGSRRNMKTFHKATRLSQLISYGPMWLAGRFAPVIIRRRQDPIYAYDVTAAS